MFAQRSVYSATSPTTGAFVFQHVGCVPFRLPLRTLGSVLYAKISGSGLPLILFAHTRSAAPTRPTSVRNDHLCGAYISFKHTQERGACKILWTDVFLAVPRSMTPVTSQTILQATRLTLRRIPSLSISLSLFFRTVLYVSNTGKPRKGGSPTPAGVGDEETRATPR